MKIRVGIIGLGYWGPNYVRNFARHENVEVAWVCDISPTAVKIIKNIYPTIKSTKNYKDILNDSTIDAVAIATPPQTHYIIVKDSLSANKHVLVAKPLATLARDVEKLLKIAKKKKKFLMGDLTFLYSNGIREIKKQIELGTIGKPLYYDSTRSNLGLIQKDVNVIWDLAPHDLSIIHYCFGLRPKKVLAVGSKHYLHSQGQELAHITIEYTNNFFAHIHLSWLSPIKLRTIFVGGTKKMMYFNDIEPDEKVRIYDKQVTIQSEKITPFKPVYRIGDVLIPRIGNDEALQLEIQDFINQLISNKASYENAQLNSDIVKILEACDKSLKLGKQIKL